MDDKILAINCSPRKGNCHILLSTIPKDKCEILNLYDYDIQPCDGCGRCNELGKCKIEDQFGEVIKKINQFNKIIIATPIYRLDVPSKVRCLIERTSSLLINNKNFEDKIVGIVCIGRFGGNGKIQALHTLVDFLLSMGCIIISPIVIGNAHKIGEIKNDLISEQSFKMLVDKISRIKLMYE